jgi:hypothetical protein
MSPISFEPFPNRENKQPRRYESCADDVIVAEDTEGGLRAPGAGLCIGVGNGYAADTFFSGLIGDVRIYNRAVRP